MLVDIFLPLPPNQLKEFVRALCEKVALSGPLPNTSVEDLYELAGVIDEQIERLPEAARDDWKKLSELVDPTPGG